MPNEVFEVQGPVTRAESVRQKLANATWDTGASAFVANGVPFSFTTGPELAARVSDLAVFLAEEAEGRSLTVHDVGAGTGYLTRHVVEEMDRRDPGLARACRYVASDSSDRMVREMPGVFLDVPGDLADRVTFCVADALSPDDLVGNGPSIYLLSYLLDAVPPRHVIRSSDGWREALVQTYLVADGVVVDGSVWPPRVLQGEGLLEVLRTAPESLSPGAVLQVLPLLVEGAVEGPVLPGVSKAFVPDTASLPFYNARPDAAAALSEIVGRLEAESLVLITDFGYSGKQVPRDFEVLMTEYGGAACYAVCFDELVAAASKAGATCCLRAGAAGGTHTLAIYKGSREAELRTLFNATYLDVDPDAAAADLFDRAEDTPLEEVLSVEKLLRKRCEAGEAVPYAILAGLAQLLAVHGRDEASCTWATKCESRYSLVAAPEQLLLGDLALKRRDLAEAIGWYERARTTAPTFSPAHLKAAEFYLAQAQLDDYAAAMRAYVRVTDEQMPVHVTWLVESADRGVQDVPVEVLKEFQDLCRVEFG